MNCWTVDRQQAKHCALISQVQILEQSTRVGIPQLAVSHTHASAVDTRIKTMCLYKQLATDDISIAVSSRDLVEAPGNGRAERTRPLSYSATD